MTRQKLGQHFLTSDAWRERILQTLSLGRDETWVEIGAGHGEMTQLLCGERRRVIAIETDPILAEGLRQRANAWPGVEILEADALGVDFAKLTDGSLRVYGNLPYYITSPLLHRVFRAAERITSIHIVIQLEVAERIAAEPGGREYGYLSVMCQLYSKPRIVFRIPPGAFRPPPLVTSALVQLDLTKNDGHFRIANDERFLKFVQGCFAQKRKTLRNNLRALLPAEQITPVLDSLKIGPDARAEQLSVAEFADLYRIVQTNSM
jgi:16S rRNA (adenine1518-N6/adenine1519-N6)-dimethyltransferase